MTWLEGKQPLERLQEIILGLTEVDQEVATLQTFYRAGSRERVMKRYQEIIGTLMNEVELVKALTPDSYVDKKDS